MRSRPMIIGIAAALAASMGAVGSALGMRASAEPYRMPSISGGPFGRGKSRPGRRTWSGTGSRYMPHQGAQECLRRRMGGNAMRIRMERAGRVWDDSQRRYVPRDLEASR